MEKKQQQTHSAAADIFRKDFDIIVLVRTGMEAAVD